MKATRVISIVMICLLLTDKLKAPGPRTATRTIDIGPTTGEFAQTRKANATKDAAASSSDQSEEELEPMEISGIREKWKIRPGFEGTEGSTENEERTFKKKQQHEKKKILFRKNCPVGPRAEGGELCEKIDLGKFMKKSKFEDLFEMVDFEFTFGASEDNVDLSKVDKIGLTFESEMEDFESLVKFLPVQAIQDLFFGSPVKAKDFKSGTEFGLMAVNRYLMTPTSNRLDRLVQDWDQKILREMLAREMKEISARDKEENLKDRSRELMQNAPQVNGYELTGVRVRNEAGEEEEPEPEGDDDEEEEEEVNQNIQVIPDPNPENRIVQGDDVIRGPEDEDLDDILRGLVENQPEGWMARIKNRIGGILHRFNCPNLMKKTLGSLVLAFIVIYFINRMFFSDGDDKTVSTPENGSMNNNDKIHIVTHYSPAYLQKMIKMSFDRKLPLSPEIIGMVLKEVTKGFKQTSLAIGMSWKASSKYFKSQITSLAPMIKDHADPFVDWFKKSVYYSKIEAASYSVYNLLTFDQIQDVILKSDVLDKSLNNNIISLMTNNMDQKEYYIHAFRMMSKDKLKKIYSLYEIFYNNQISVNYDTEGALNSLNKLLLNRFKKTVLANVINKALQKGGNKDTFKTGKTNVIGMLASINIYKSGVEALAVAFVERCKNLQYTDESWSLNMGKLSLRGAFGVGAASVLLTNPTEKNIFDNRFQDILNLKARNMLKNVYDNQIKSRVRAFFRGHIKFGKNSIILKKTVKTFIYDVFSDHLFTTKGLKKSGQAYFDTFYDAFSSALSGFKQSIQNLSIIDSESAVFKRVSTTLMANLVQNYDFLSSTIQGLVQNMTRLLPTLKDLDLEIPYHNIEKLSLLDLYKTFCIFESLTSSLSRSVAYQVMKFFVSKTSFFFLGIYISELPVQVISEVVLEHEQKVVDQVLRISKDLMTQYPAKNAINLAQQKIASKLWKSTGPEDTEEFILDDKFEERLEKLREKALEPKKSASELKKESAKIMKDFGKEEFGKKKIRTDGLVNSFGNEYSNYQGSGYHPRLRVQLDI